MNGHIGDYGTTLVGRERIPKTDCRVISLGKIDTLMSQVYRLGDAPIYTYFIRVLRNITSEISGFHHGASPNDVLFLEKEIERLNIKLESFIDFNTLQSIELNEARVRTREAEIACIDSEISEFSKAFLNRLSSYFFALACYYNKK